MLARLLHFILRLVCEWRGHDEARYEPAGRGINLAPGAITQIPTQSLLEFRKEQVLPGDVIAQMPAEMKYVYFKRLLNPPVVVHRMYCLRCGEAWD